MNLAIYETEHFETAYTLIKVFGTKENKVTLFVTPEIFTRLKKMDSGCVLQSTIVYLKPGSAFNTWLIYKKCKKNHIRLLLLNTVGFHHLFFGFLCLLLTNTKTSLTIHDANSFFKPEVKLSARSILRYAGKKLLRLTVDYYITLLLSTKEFIETKFQPAKPVYTLPGAIFDSNKTRSLFKSNSAVIIVIPGSVDEKRRNYQELFHVLSLLHNQTNLIEIVLLGTGKEGKGYEIINKCQSYASSNLKILTYSEDFVDQHEYDRQLSRCDFVYAPIQKKISKESIFAEEYGLTKTSGCFFDAIRFGKPLIVASDIHLSTEIIAQCITYKSPQKLAEFIGAMNTHKKEYYSNQALQNSKNFTIESIQNRFSGFKG